jgi:DNA polymerase III epsilon subunit-like protein
VTVVQLGVTPIAVIDLETTSLRPSQGRVVEIAVIRLAPDGTLIDTWDTLINPQCDAGPTHAHGITSEHLVKAPLFADVADELAVRLDGAIVTAHNINFDFNFLRFEYLRLGQLVPSWPLLCTVRLANRLGRATQARSRSLVDLCALEGIPHPPGVHTALGDATATARLVRVYLHYAARFGFDYPDLGVRPVRLPVSHAPVVGATKALRRTV